VRAATALIAALVVIASSTIFVPPAFANGRQVVADCNANGRLTHKYSLPELQNALSTMGAATKEYTNCYDVIQHAVVAAATGGKAGGGGAGGAPSTKSDSLPTALVVVLALLVLTAAGYATVAIRRAIVRRRTESSP